MPWRGAPGQLRFVWRGALATTGLAQSGEAATELEYKLWAAPSLVVVETEVPN
jgi:hypothetical protein